MPRNIDALNVRIVNNKLKAQRLKVNEWKRGCVYLVYLVSMVSIVYLVYLVLLKFNPLDWK